MHSVQLRHGHEHGKTLLVAAKLAEGLGLTDGERLVLRCGQSFADGVILMVQERMDSNRVCISKQVREELSVPIPLSLHIKRESDGSIRLGPIVGVLARSTRSLSERFMSQTPYFAALVRTGRRIGVPTYVITPEGIDWERNRVRAWGISSGRWYRLYIPIPDVVYDRVQTRKLDLLPRTREVKRKLADHPGIKMFNTGFLDKWETHTALESAGAERLLPETKLLTSRQELLEFTRRFRSVFVKPAGGSLGKGIWVIQRRGGRYHIIHYGEKRVRRLRNLRSPGYVWRRLQRMRRKRRYVVQQGVQFARYRGRRFDMRLLAQKGGDNEWVISACYARVAPPGSLRSNLDAGGKAVRSSRVMRHIFGRRGPRVLRRVLAAGITIAKAMEEATDGVVGELGIDIGVDRAGRPWMIEANSKPLRQMEGPRKRLARTLRRPLHFARHLAGF